MKDFITVKDEFCDQSDLVRASAIGSGFGSLKPASNEMGRDSYEGMNFLGRHDLMLRALSAAIGGRPVYPGAMFFRATKPGMDKAYVHSDRMHGDWTCIVYLSEHTEESGTGFYRHRRTGWNEMPAPEILKQAGVLSMMDECMKKNDPADWEQAAFVRGIYNRAVIFRAPLFHCRHPADGLGDGKDETARMTWVAHFGL